jgi:hypothetical protein
MTTRLYAVAGCQPVGFSDDGRTYLTTRGDVFGFRDGDTLYSMGGDPLGWFSGSDFFDNDGRPRYFLASRGGQSTPSPASALIDKRATGLQLA